MPRRLVVLLLVTSVALFNGYYRFPSLPVGLYRVQVEAAGFRWMTGCASIST